MEVIPIFSNIKRKLILNRELKSFSTRFSYVTTSDEERIAMTMNYLQEYDMLPFKRSDSLELRKSALVSTELRDAGNKLFVNDTQQAVWVYSKSIAAAPYPSSDADDSADLAMGFANRSAAYFTLQKYDACVRDVQQALKFAYPDTLRYKLLERRGVCYRRLGRSDEATLSFQEALKHLPLATFLSASKMKSEVRSLQHLANSVDCDRHTHGGVVDHSRPLPTKTCGQHADIPCAADCLDIKYSERVGRHVVASKDIDPGDILFVEKPFTSVVLPEYCLTHCNCCLKRSEAMIPCKVCDLAMYCSESCRESSWTLSHNTECWLVPCLRRLDVGESPVFLLPLRMLLTACSESRGIAGLHRQVLATSEAERPDQCVQGGEDPPSSSYRQVHSLCHHTVQESDFQLAWAVGVASIVNCLHTFSDFFSISPDSLSSRPDRLRLFAGGLLLRYIGIISTNCFSVTEWVTSRSAQQVEEVPFGNAIYLTVSFLNHSCYPNALNSFHHGDVHVVTAKRPIRRGEEIAISYAGSFTHSEFSERNLELRMNYCFDCVCEACSNLWPTFEHLQPMSSPVFLCQQCRSPLPHRVTDSLTCAECGHLHDGAQLVQVTTNLLDRIIDMYNDIKSGSRHDHKPELAAAVKLLDGIVQSPCQLTAACQQYLRYSMKITGNNYRPH